jgi:hypothetical protein
MTVKRLRPKQIALAQLKTALTLFLDGTDFISSITLAGATEEILGSLLRKRKRAPSVKRRAEQTRALFRALWPNRPDPGVEPFIDLSNKPRNALKHLTTTKPLAMDTKADAARLLLRAVENYHLLYGHRTPAMLRFERAYLRAVRPSHGA